MGEEEKKLPVIIDEARQGKANESEGIARGSPGGGRRVSRQKGTMRSMAQKRIS